MNRIPNRKTRERQHIFFRWQIKKNLNNQSSNNVVRIAQSKHHRIIWNKMKNDQILFVPMMKGFDNKVIIYFYFLLYVYNICDNKEKRKSNDTSTFLFHYCMEDTLFRYLLYRLCILEGSRFYHAATKLSCVHSISFRE